MIFFGTEKRRTGSCIVLAALLSLLACDAGLIERTVRVSYDLNSGFWAQPLPSLTREDSLDATAPEARGELFDAAARTVRQREGQGWIVMPLTGEVQRDTLPVFPSLRRDASVFVLDIDASSPEQGRRIPSEVRSLEGSERDQAGPGLVIEIELEELRPDTLYATVVTDQVLSSANERIGRSETFHAAFEGNSDGNERLIELLNELRGTLVADGVELQVVAGAALFRSAPR